MNLFVFLNRKRRWSRETFGPDYSVAQVLQHLDKEVTEVKAAPGDLMEWVDVVNLGLEGAMRAGFTPHEICEGILAKHAELEAREWVHVHGAPSEHVREADGGI